MNKKMIVVSLLVILLTTAVLGTVAAQDKVQIYIYQDKYEIDSALKAACDAYTKENPNVTFNVESSSSGEFQTQLKTMFAGGQCPDIFSTKGSDDMAIMAEYMEDLSDQEWVPFMTAAAVEAGSIDGVTYGFPISEETYGYVYHKDLFEKAGIENVPTTLTELADDCEKLKASGIETPIAANYSEWYQSGMFKFSSAVSRQADPMAFIAGLNDGSQTLVGNPEIANLAKWIDIDVKYANSPLNTDFNKEVSDFANKTCAIMLGGSWSQPALDDIDPEMNVGLFALPMSENAEETKLFTSSSPFWSVNKDSKNKEESKKFLNWLAMNEEGQNYLSNEFGLIPAFTNISVDEKAIGPLGTDSKAYIDAGNTYGIYSSFFPNGMGGAQLFGEAVNKYAAGVINADQFAEELQADWSSLVTQ